MLNDAAKERERVMEVAVETESLERLVGNGGWEPGDATSASSAAGHAGSLGQGMHFSCPQWDTRTLGFMGITLCEAGILVCPMAGTCPFAAAWQGVPRPAWAGAMWQVVAQGLPPRG